jgi:hypothetical protein
MATDIKTDETSSMTSLVSGIVHDAEVLIGQQFELFKHELRADMHNAMGGAMLLGVGGGVGLAATVLLGQTLVFVLQTMMPELPLWACYAICCGLFAALSACLVAIGLNKLNAANSLPVQSAEALKENFQWKTNPK